MDAVASSRPAGPDRLDPLTDDPLLRALFPALATNVEWGLERTERALAALHDPHRAFRSLHVGGTNGKGSVTATLASACVRGGRRVGCYTSPHLCSFRERILVDGCPIDELVLRAYADEARDPIARFGLTFFEAATVLAFHTFAREGVEVAAVEVGLGGRLDATNVLTPEVSAVTNIGMDHMDYLGNTLAAIAREKAGIIKPGVPFVTGEGNPELLGLFAGQAHRAGTTMHVVDPTRLRDVVITRATTSFRLSTRAWGDLDVVTPLAGAHQAMNAAVAIEMLAHVSDELRPTRDALLEGVRRVRHHGRNEIRTLDGVTWLFDVAHNPAGIATLVDTLERLELPGPRVALIGVLADKEWRTMLPELLARVDTAVLTVPPSAPADRKWDVGAAAEALGAGHLGASERRPAVRAITDFGEALATAATHAGRGTVVVTGSVHTVGNAMRLLGVDPVG